MNKIFNQMTHYNLYRLVPRFSKILIESQMVPFFHLEKNILRVTILKFWILQITVFMFIFLGITTTKLSKSTTFRLNHKIPTT